MTSGRSRLTHDAMRGMFWVAFGRGARALLQVAVLGVLARLLAPDDFGVVSAALVVIGFTAIFAQLGFGPALVQREELEPRHLRTAFTVSLLSGFALGGLLWLLAPAIAAFYRIDEVAPVMRALAWAFPLKGLAVVSESLLQRDLRFRYLANREVVSYALGYGLLGVALAMAGLGVWALVGAHMGQIALNTALLLLARRRGLRLGIDRRALGELAFFGGGFTAAKVGNYFALQGDNLVVGRWLGSAALGIYGRAYQLMAMPATLFGDVLDTVLFPAMARVQADPERLATAYRRGVALVALVMLPASAALVVWAPEVVHVMLGPQWSAVTLPFQVFACGLLFRTSYKMSDAIARATGAVYRRAWRQGVYASLVVGGAWVGQHWGVTGVAVGVFGALAVNFTMMAALSLSLARMSWRSFLVAHRPAMTLAVVVGGLAWGLARLLRSSGHAPLETLAVGGGLTALTAIVLAVRWPAGFLGPDGSWMVSSAWAHLVAGRRAAPAPEPGMAAGLPAEVEPIHGTERHA
ncbi:MAG TPA: lipopolysaccharide biosynthesis protein [Gemmatimonadales bacterium]|nr:lipopolysaccharide biosynthesis protein [Gemmatimonadales bacterium]